MSTVTKIFGSKVFDDRVMKAKLPAKIYNSLRRTIDEGVDLDIGVANAVASAMKDWAVENGATHYTQDVYKRQKWGCIWLSMTEIRIWVNSSSRSLVRRACSTCKNKKITKMEMVTARLSKATPYTKICTHMARTGSRI